MSQETPKCPRCNEKSYKADLRSILSYREWKRSLLCQGCQDEVFGDYVRRSQPFDVAVSDHLVRQISNKYGLQVTAGENEMATPRFWYHLDPIGVICVQFDIREATVAEVDVALDEERDESMLFVITHPERMLVNSWTFDDVDVLKLENRRLDGRDTLEMLHQIPYEVYTYTETTIAYTEKATGWRERTS